MSSWFVELDKEFTDMSRRAVGRFEEYDYERSPVYPASNLDIVYRAFDLTPPGTTKVLILGQDPYPRPEHPTGLSFGVPPNTDPLPSSLANISKELKADTGDDLTDPTLVSWAKQGCLMLNRHLTVGSSPLGHKHWGWDKRLTSKVIAYLAARKEPCVFVLWGAESRKFAEPLVKSGGNNKLHLILSAAHPTKASAAKGFFGSNPFSQTNEWLVSHGLEPIHWGASL